MSFELRHDESISKGIRRVSRKQLETALLTLQDRKLGSVDDRIHAARKKLKHVRATLRLVRDSIGKSAYQAENRALRDASRPLSEIRDAKVLLETLDGLKKKFKKHSRKAYFDRVRRKLAVHQREVRKKVLDDRRALDKATKAIQNELSEVKNWKAEGIGWRKVGKGIKRVYRDARDAFDAVKSDAAVEKLHELRKQAKYLRYQLELLAPIWRKVVGKLAGQAKALGDTLGDDHDLAVLRSMLVDNAADDRLDEEMCVLVKLVDRERKRLERKAIAGGEILYRDPPKQLVGRLKAYWHRW